MARNWEREFIMVVVPGASAITFYLFLSLPLTPILCARRIWRLPSNMIDCQCCSPMFDFPPPPVLSSATSARSFGYYLGWEAHEHFGGTSAAPRSQSDLKNQIPIQSCLEGRARLVGDVRMTPANRRCTRGPRHASYPAATAVAVNVCTLPSIYRQNPYG